MEKHPHVATVSEPQNEGGAGATVVEFAGLIARDRRDRKRKISPRRRGPKLQSRFFIKPESYK
jgi:hypothetical protein